MASTPENLCDAKELLSENGFATGETWYHGTSSALLGSIKGSGLRRSGDKAMNQAAKKTMATIGNNYTEQLEPIFLTQSKQLAYYWAEQAVRRRSVRVEGDETPVVLALNLPEELRSEVRPDVGAAGLIMIKEGEHYMGFLAQLYEQCDVGVLDIDLIKAERDEYLNKLGMAYLDKDVAPGFVSIVES